MVLNLVCNTKNSLVTCRYPFQKEKERTLQNVTDPNVPSNK